MLKLSAQAAAALGLGRLTGFPSALAAETRPPLARLPELDQLKITSLVDWGIEPGLPAETTGACTVRRPPSPRAALAGGRRTHLLAEYGHAFLIESERGAEKRTVLHDFSLSPTALLNNMDFLGVNPGAIDALVLSHGHADHYGGLGGFLTRHGARLRRGLPLFVGHENAFADRWKVKKGKERAEGRLGKKEFEPAGLHVQIAPGPLVVADHTGLSGLIPMVNTYEKSSPSARIRVAGHYQPDMFEEELALVYRLRGKGLVVITSCGHRGLINTLHHAQIVTGETRIVAIIGGLHLAKHSGPALDKTVQALKDMRAQTLIPMHCTGTRSARRLRREFPAATILNAAGSSYEFA